MNIETIKLKNSQNMDDINFKIINVDDLFANLSSNYSFHCNSSFEESKDIFADLYDKDNAFERRINFFQFPQHVMNLSKNFIDKLFDNEMQKRKEIELEIIRKSRFEYRLSRGSKINDLFEKLTNSNKKRLKRNKKLENKKNFASIDDNFNFGVDDQDLDSSKENEFRIEEDDWDGIQKNDVPEDSFQMDFSGIMNKTQNKKNKKRKHKRSDINSELSCDKNSHNDSKTYKKKHKQKIKKKRKKNKCASKNNSIEDSDHLNQNIDEENILIEDISKKHKKKRNKNNSSYEDERKNKNYRNDDKIIIKKEANNKKSKISNEESIDFDIKINEDYKTKKNKIEKDKKGKKKKKKYVTDNKDEYMLSKKQDSHSKNSNIKFTISQSDHSKNSRIKPLDIRNDNKSIDESENSKSFSIDLSSSKTSSLSSSLQTKKRKNNSDSSSDSRTSNSYNSDSESYRNNESSKNSSSISKSNTSNSINSIFNSSKNSKFVAEKKIIENKLMKEYEVNPNDNTYEREKKLEKLKKFNHKIDQIKPNKAEKVKVKAKISQSKRNKNTDENKNPEKYKKFKNNKDHSENFDKSKEASKKSKKHHRERISSTERYSSENSLIDEDLNRKQEQMTMKHKKKVYEKRLSSKNGSKSEIDINDKKHNNYKKFTSKKDKFKKDKKERNEKSKYDATYKENKNKKDNFKSEKKRKQKSKREKISSSSLSLTSSSEESNINHRNSSLGKREKKKLKYNKLKKSELEHKKNFEEINLKRKRNKDCYENEQKFLIYSNLKVPDKNLRKNNLNNKSRNMNNINENGEPLTLSDHLNNSNLKNQILLKKRNTIQLNGDDNFGRGKNSNYSQKFLIDSKNNNSKDKLNKLNTLVNCKALNDIKPIRKHKRNLEKEDNEENSFSTLQTSRAINLTNKYIKKKNFLNSKCNLLEENKSNSNYFAYLKGREKRSKYEKEDYFKQIKKRKKEFETIIDDGSAIQKLKLLKRQISLQKKKEISNQKLLIFAKILLKKSLSTLESGGILDSIIKPKTNSNIQNGIEPILLFNKHLKDSKSISLNVHSKKISEFNFSKDSKNEDIKENNNIDINNSVNNRTLTSPVASIIKNPINIKDEILKIFQSIKLIKDEKPNLKENLEEEKSKIEKKNLINLLIEKFTNGDHPKSINNSSLNNGIVYDETSKNIPVPLKYNIPKFSNDHIHLDKIKNNYFEEFKKVKYNLENVRNINTKVSKKSELECKSNFNLNNNKFKYKNRHSHIINRKYSKLIANNIDCESKSNEIETVNIDNKNSKKINKEQETIDNEENEINKQKDSFINKESKRDIDHPFKQEEVICSSKNKNNNNMSNSKKSEDENLIDNKLNYDNQNNNKYEKNNQELNNKDDEISNNNCINNQNYNNDNYKRSHDAIETMEKHENLNVSVKKETINFDEIKLNNDNEKFPKINPYEVMNLEKNILPELNKEKLLDKPKTLKETPKENKKNPFKFLNNNLKFLTKEIIKSLKISQKLLKDKIENQENILSLKSIDKYFNSNLLNQNSNEIKNSNIKTLVEEENHKAKDLSIKEGFKMINDNKKKNFQQLIKLNMQKIQDKISFDFDNENAESYIINQNVKNNTTNKFVPQINNNTIKENINNKKINSKNIYDLDSIKLKSIQEFNEQKPFSPLSPLKESTNIGIIRHSETISNDSNFIEIIRTKEKNFSPLFENALSNNNAGENRSKNCILGKTNTENLFQLSSNLKGDNNDILVKIKENTNKISIKRRIKSLNLNKNQINSIDSNKDLLMVEKNRHLPLDVLKKERQLIKDILIDKNFKQNMIIQNEEKANVNIKEEKNKKAMILSSKTSNLSIAGIKKNIIHDNKILEFKLPQIK